MDRSVGNAWPTTRTASRLGCRWPRRGRDGTIQSRLREEGGFRTSLRPELEPRDARSGGCGFELAILNQGNNPANKAPPPPDLASLRQREADPDQSRDNCGSLLGCEPAQGWARGTCWGSFPRAMPLVVLASPPRLPTESSEEPKLTCLIVYDAVFSGNFFIRPVTPDTHPTQSVPAELLQPAVCRPGKLPQTTPPSSPARPPSPRRPRSSPRPPRAGSTLP